MAILFAAAIKSCIRKKKKNRRVVSDFKPFLVQSAVFSMGTKSYPVRYPGIRCVLKAGFLVYVVDCIMYPLESCHKSEGTE